MSWPGDTRNKVVMLAALVGLIALLHYVTPTEPHNYHVIHIVLRKLYFLPPVVAAAWFGLRGAIFTTTAVSLLFTLHAIMDWPGNYMEQANQMGELAGFWVVGLLPGWLFDRRRALLTRLAQANEETLISLVSALDLRERNTRLHSQRVRDYTLLLAARHGVPEYQLRDIAYGALLHDIGKIAVPDRILLKPAKLTDDEMMQMKRHPFEGFQLVQRIGFLAQAAEIVHAHHERFDGSGYPRGLKGGNIPLGARFFAIADVFDALTSDRPYHDAVSYDEAAGIIAAGSGSHFDPDIVSTFLAIAPSKWYELRNRQNLSVGIECKEL